MKNRRLLNIAMVVLFVLATVLYVKMQSMDTKSPTGSDNGNVIDVPVDATPEEVKDALTRGKDEGKDVIINLEESPSAEEIATLPDCDELLDALIVGPPISDQTQCRTAEGQATLLTVALEDSPEWEFVGPGEPMKRKR